MLETLYHRLGLESFGIRLEFDEPPVSSSYA